MANTNEIAECPVCLSNCVVTFCENSEDLFASASNQMNQQSQMSNSASKALRYHNMLPLRGPQQNQHQSPGTTPSAW